MSSATSGWLRGGGVGIGADGIDEVRFVTCPDTTPPRSAAASAMKRLISENGWMEKGLDVEMVMGMKSDHQVGIGAAFYICNVAELAVLGYISWLYFARRLLCS